MEKNQTTVEKDYIICFELFGIKKQAKIKASSYQSAQTKFYQELPKQIKIIYDKDCKGSTTSTFVQEVEKKKSKFKWPWKK